MYLKKEPHHHHQSNNEKGKRDYVLYRFIYLSFLAPVTPRVAAKQFKDYLQVFHSESYFNYSRTCYSYLTLWNLHFDKLT